MNLKAKILSLLILPLALFAEDNTVIKVFNNRYANWGPIFLLEDKTLWRTYSTDYPLEKGDLLDKDDFYFHNYGTLENRSEIADVVTYNHPFTPQDWANIAKKELNDEQVEDQISTATFVTLTNGTQFLLEDPSSEATPWKKGDKVYYIESSDVLLNMSMSEYDIYPEQGFVSKQIEKNRMNVIQFVGERATWNILTGGSMPIPNLLNKERIFCLDEEEPLVTFPIVQDEENDFSVKFAEFILKEKFYDEKSLSGKGLYLRMVVPTSSNQIIYLWKVE